MNRFVSSENETAAVRLIRDGVSATFKDENGQVAMHYAAKYGKMFKSSESIQDT